MENLGSAIVEHPCQSWSIQGIARHVKRPGGFWQTSQNRRACWRGLQPIHFPRPLIFGRYVGHSGILHGCTVKDEVLVGMGSIIHDDAVIGERSIIGAGALVSVGTVIPPGGGCGSRLAMRYQYEMHRLLYKWLNRHSQRRSMTWRPYCERWKTWEMPAARVVETFPSQALHRPPKPA